MKPKSDRLVVLSRRARARRGSDVWGVEWLEDRVLLSRGSGGLDASRFASSGGGDRHGDPLGGRTSEVGGESHGNGESQRLVDAVSGGDGGGTGSRGSGNGLSSSGPGYPLPPAAGPALSAEVASQGRPIPVVLPVREPVLFVPPTLASATGGVASSVPAARAETTATPATLVALETATGAGGETLSAIASARATATPPVTTAGTTPIPTSSSATTTGLPAHAASQVKGPGQSPTAGDAPGLAQDGRAVGPIETTARTSMAAGAGQAIAALGTPRGPGAGVGPTASSRGQATPTRTLPAHLSPDYPPNALTPLDLTGSGGAAVPSVLPLLEADGISARGNAAGDASEGPASTTEPPAAEAAGLARAWESAGDWLEELAAVEAAEATELAHRLAPFALAAGLCVALGHHLQAARRGDREGRAAGVEDDALEALAGP